MASHIGWIKLSGLRIEHARIGIHPHEHGRDQLLIIHCELMCDFGKAAQSDHIDDTVDYDAVCRKLSEVATARHYELVEALIETLASAVLNQFENVKTVRLELQKPGALTQAAVAVAIERSR